MSNLPTLYKTGSRGLEQWRVYVDDFEDSSDIVVEWGMVGGALQEKRTKIKLGKNIGKSNETTIGQQARAEAASKLLKQIDKGYSESKKAQKKVLPMLAKVYGDCKKKVKFPVFVQPKLDGLRCLALGTNMTSRKGKPINTAEHIYPDIEKVIKKFPDIYLDGELYNHGESFETIVSAVKRDEVNEASGKINYCVYDCFFEPINDNSEKFRERLEILKEIEALSLSFLKIVPTFVCKTEDELYEKHSEFIAAGYEGTIVRLDAPYEIDKRSFNLLKLKDFMDDEFKIIGAEEDKNGHAVFTCETKEGYEFRVKPEGDDAHRKNLWKNHKKYIGELLTVKFFEWTSTENPVPRFPVGRIQKIYD